MHRKMTLRRGSVALALAAAFVFAGARPAAAEEPRLFRAGMGWLTGFWNEIVERDVYGLGGLLSLWEAAEETEQGFGVDPNGTSVQPEPAPLPSGEGR